MAVVGPHTHKQGCPPGCDGRHYGVNIYQGPGKKRKWIGEGGLTLEEAEALNERAKDQHLVESESVAGFAGRWVKEFPRPKASTNDMNKHLARQIARHFGNKPMRGVTRQEARSFIRAKPHIIGAVRAMFRDAVEEGIIEANPFSRLGIAQSKGRRDLVILTPEEIQTLAQTCLELWAEQPVHAFKMRAMVLTLAETGVRPGELFALERQDVDLPNQTLTVRGRFDRRGRYDVPKNGRTRTVFLPPQAAQAIKELQTDIHSTYLFTNQAGRPFQTTSFAHYFRQLRSAFEAKLDPIRKADLQRSRRKGAQGLEPYEMRHFTGWYLLNILRLSPEDVAVQLGHQDGGALVLALYGHLDKDMARERIRDAYQRAAGGVA